MVCILITPTLLSIRVHYRKERDGKRKREGDKKGTWEIGVAGEGMKKRGKTKRREGGDAGK